jgi:hypothetical protein
LLWFLHDVLVSTQINAFIYYFSVMHQRDTIFVPLRKMRCNKPINKQRHSCVIRNLYCFDW